jgi:hypothetical protein
MLRPFTLLYPAPVLAGGTVIPGHIPDGLQTDLRSIDQAWAARRPLRPSAGSAASRVREVQREPG